MPDDLPRILDRLDAALDRIEATEAETRFARERHDRLRSEVAQVVTELDDLVETPTDG